MSSIHKQQEITVSWVQVQQRTRWNIPSVPIIRQSHDVLDEEASVSIRVLAVDGSRILGWKRRHQIVQGSVRSLFKNIKILIMSIVLLFDEIAAQINRLNVVGVQPDQFKLLVHFVRVLHYFSCSAFHWPLHSATCKITARESYTFYSGELSSCSTWEHSGLA